MFVELTSTRTDDYADSRLGLRLSPANSGTPMEVFPLFVASSTNFWPTGGHLLVGSPDFAARTGLVPDLTAPRLVDANNGRVEIFRRDPLTLLDSTLVALPLGGLGLDAGHSLVRRPDGFYDVSAVVTPQRLDGQIAELLDCYVQARPEAIRISELLLRCRDGDPAGQFVEIESTDPDASFGRNVKLRLLDARGAVRGEIANLFGARGGLAWRAGRSFLVGSTQFASRFGMAPDTTLPAPLDTTGGAVQLVGTVDGVERVFDEMRYGGGAPMPLSGGSLVRLLGMVTPSTSPTPSGLAGAVPVAPACFGVCPPSWLRLGFGSEQWLEQAWGTFNAYQSEVQFDQRMGTLDMDSGSGDASVRLSDVYKLVGTSVDTAAITAHLFVHAHALQACPAGRCASSSARIALVGGGGIDSVRTTRDTTLVLAIPLVIASDRTFELGIEARATGYLSPDLDATISTRLEFEGLAPNARVVSCYGYDSRAARPVGDATFTTTARTVSIEWPVREKDFSAAVERRTAQQPWTFVEQRTPGADGVLRVVDRSVLARERYEYRLTWVDLFGAHSSEPLAVEVPAAFVFGLLGVRPNPSQGALAAAIELPEAGEVRIEVLDLAGRRVLERRRWLPAGRHDVPLSLQGGIAPGVYVVRLRQGMRTEKTTAIVLR